MLLGPLETRCTWTDIHTIEQEKKINDTIAKNKELYEINPPVSEINLYWEYISCLDVNIF